MAGKNYWAVRLVLRPSRYPWPARSALGLDRAVRIVHALSGFHHDIARYRVGPGNAGQCGRNLRECVHIPDKSVSPE